MYPDIGIEDARVRRDEARKLLAHFSDPGLQRKVHKEAWVAPESNSFEIVAREWHARWREHRLKHQRQAGTVKGISAGKAG